MKNAIRRVSFLAILAIVFSGVFAAPVELAAQKAAQKKEPLTIEGIFGGGRRSGPPAPSATRWSPDGKSLTYFLRGEKGRDLWIHDLATGEKKILVSADQLRKIAPPPAGETERERTFRTRFGVAAYRWSPGSKALMFSSGGRMFHYDIAGGEAKQIAPGMGGVKDPRYSPDAKRVAFVYKHDVWVAPTGGGKAKQVTFGGHELLLHGEFDWVYQEELRSRGAFFSGYSWSPDSRHIAFLELDESVVPIYPITEQVSRQASYDLQRYPKPGDPNPKARAGIVNVETGKTVWIDRAAEYIPRLGWAGASNALIHLMNRNQNEVELIFVDPATGKSRTFLTETDKYWVNIRDDHRFLAGGKEFLWTSERSGFRHIYIYNRDGALDRQITSGDWQVTGVPAVDEDAGWIYYTSNEANPIGGDLYRIRLDGSGQERITQEKGSHGINMNPAATAYLDRFSSLRDPGQTTLRHISSGRSEIFTPGQSNDKYDLVEPELKMIDTPDGAKVSLHILKPRKLEPGKKYPVLVYVYGMPGFPTIRDAAAGRRGLWHQFLVQQGYIVVQMDDRTASIWGHKYAALGFHNIGPVAIKDHAVGVEYLKSLPYVDGGRMGVWGWSGGGFTTTFLMTHSKLFKVGVAGAPVTDWRLYDSIYTERYMGVPEDDPEAYDRTSSVKGAENYSGRMLIIHGTHDDNVHPQNTIQLIDALIKNKKQFEIMFYPNKTHGISGSSAQVHLYTMFYSFLERYL